MFQISTPSVGLWKEHFITRQLFQGPSHVLQRLKIQLSSIALKYQEFTGALLQDKHKMLPKTLISNYSRIRRHQQPDIWIQDLKNQVSNEHNYINLLVYAPFSPDSFFYLEGGSMTVRPINLLGISETEATWSQNKLSAKTSFQNLCWQISWVP